MCKGNAKVSQFHFGIFILRDWCFLCHYPCADMAFGMWLGTISNASFEYRSISETCDKWKRRKWTLRIAKNYKKCVLGSYYHCFTAFQVAGCYFYFSLAVSYVHVPGWGEWGRGFPWIKSTMESSWNKCSLNEIRKSSSIPAGLSKEAMQNCVFCVYAVTTG